MAAKKRTKAEEAELKRLIGEQSRDDRTSQVKITAGMRVIIGQTEREERRRDLPDDDTLEEARAICGKSLFDTPDVVSEDVA